MAQIEQLIFGDGSLTGSEDVIECNVPLLEVEKQLFEGIWEERDETIQFDGRIQDLYATRRWSEYDNLIRFTQLWNRTPPAQRGRGTSKTAAWVLEPRCVTLLAPSSWYIFYYNSREEIKESFSPEVVRHAQEMLAEVITLKAKS